MCRALMLTPAQVWQLVLQCTFIRKSPRTSELFRAYGMFSRSDSVRSRLHMPYVTFDATNLAGCIGVLPARVAGRTA
jgi:hypothetical protein